jgi:drug/metabolite transporter (DMT)-like permease
MADEPRVPLKAIGLVLSAFMFFGLLDGCAKYLGAAGFAAVWVVWVRYTGHALFVVLTLRGATARTVWRTSRLRLQLLRGLFLFGSTACNFTAIRYLQLAEAGAINASMPLLVAALAVPVLGERIGIRRWTAILVGCLGVLVVLRPTPELFQPAALLSVGTALCSACYLLTTRLLAQSDAHQTTNLYGAIVGVAITTPLVPFFWTTPEGIEWLPTLAIGVLGAVGHHALTAAHQHAQAGALAPFWYTQILWAIVVGFVWFGDVPDALTLLGAGIVLASGLYVWWRERVKRPRGAGT